MPFLELVKKSTVVEVLEGKFFSLHGNSFIPFLTCFVPTERCTKAVMANMVATWLPAEGCFYLLAQSRVSLHTWRQMG